MESLPNSLKSTRSSGATDVGVPFGCPTIRIYGVQISHGPRDKAKENAHTEGNSPRSEELTSVVVFPNYNPSR